MINHHNKLSLRVLLLGLVAIVIFLVLGLGSLSYAQTNDYKNVIRVNNISDEDKKNDGFCTLREAVIVANKGQASTGKPGECAIENTDPIINGFTILVPSGYYSLYRTDNGNEDSSATGDLDVNTQTKFLNIIGCEPDPNSAPEDLYQCALPYEAPQDPLNGPVVISGDNITDRVFHILTGTVTIKNVTIRGGNVNDFGGGIYNQGGTLNLINSTLTQNKVAGGGKGGGLANDAGATSTLTHVTISDNSAASGSGSGLARIGGTLNIRNSLIFDDTCNNIATSSNHIKNLAYLDGGTCSNVAALNDDPKLVAINTDGAEIDSATCNAATENCTVAYFTLGEGSPAIDNADNTICEDSTLALVTDQVFRDRKQGSACDIGAYEADKVAAGPTANPQVIGLNGEVIEDKDYTFALDVTAGDSSINWSSFRVTSGPTHGSISGPDPSNGDMVTYQPFNNPPTNPRHYNGDDGYPPSDDSFTYEIYDDLGIGPATATVEIEITPDAYIEVTNLCDGFVNPGEPISGSLRAAIEQANEDPGFDNIVFDIFDYSCGPFVDPNAATPVPVSYPADPATYPYVINLDQALPDLQYPVSIDGLGVDGVDTDGDNIPDGSFTPPSSIPYITLNGSPDGVCDNYFNGITILGSAGGTIVSNLKFKDIGGSSIVIGEVGNPSNGNTISGNVITGSGCASPDPDTVSDGTIVYNDGITVLPNSVNNLFSDNQISGSAGESIDLNAEGPTENDEGDTDTGANDIQNYPWLISATPSNGTVNNLTSGVITGRFNSDPNTDYLFEFFKTDGCEGTGSVSTPLSVSESQFNSDEGDIIFHTTVLAPDTLDYGDFIVATATNLTNNNTSEYSRCIPVNDDNVVWTQALDIEPGFPITQKLIQVGESRWYKIGYIPPNSKVKFKLNLDLPGNPADWPEEISINPDLVAYGDILQAYNDLLSNGDLPYQDANFPNEAFAASQFNATMFNASQFNASQFNASQFNASQWNELIFNPALLDTAIYSEDVWSAATFAASQFNASQFNASQWNATQWNPASELGNAYASAQYASVLAVSANDGQDSEEVAINTYGNGGTYYARIRGREGSFDDDVSFTIEVTVESSVCDGLVDNFGLSRNFPGPEVVGNYETLILVDYARMQFTNQQERDALTAKLADLAGATNGLVVDLGSDQEILKRHGQADNTDAAIPNDYRECPYAQNVVAEGIRDYVKYLSDDYNPNNLLKYVVIVGDDSDIPFYRIADKALLGPEEMYVPPVLAGTSSFGSLNYNTILTQDPYVAGFDVQTENTAVPIPSKITIGRLVETPQEIMTMIDAYLANPTITPSKALVGAYDFLKDSGFQTSSWLAGSDNSLPVDQLINDTWTADDLTAELGNLSPQSLVYLAGHFSANAALAADYNSILTTQAFEQIPGSPTAFTNSIIFSAGCHSGYNIVNAHGTPATYEPDWAAVSARLGITLIAGTGYQYADTDLNKYSEWLYTEFSHQLRSNAATAIPIGEALRQAKLEYMKQTPVLRGIDQKSLLIATIFGLPMTKVNMPGERYDLSGDGGSLTTGDLTPAGANPGFTYGLKWKDLTRSYVDPADPDPFWGDSHLNPYEVDLDDVYAELDPITTTYLRNESPGVNVGDPNAGIFSSPGEPTLPLDTFDATIVDNPGLILRDVGFLGGSYTDFTGMYPLMGAPGTELSLPHFSFLSFVFYPQKPWSINRFDALANPNGSTLVNITPTEYRSEQPTQADVARTATMRRFDDMTLRLFYLPENLNNAVTGTSDPRNAAPPTIIQVLGSNSPNTNNSNYYDLHFDIQAVVDPSAGMQEVWISWTRESQVGPGNVKTEDEWQWLPLTQQDPTDSSWWSGTLDGETYGITDPLNVRFIVQAASGTGLVTMANNLGRFYIPGESGLPTELVELNGPTPRVGAVGTSVNFEAKLTSEGVALEDQPVLFSIGQDFRLGWTDEFGEVAVDIPLTGSPAGVYDVIISYPGSAVYQASNANTDSFEVLAQSTTLVLDPDYALVSTLDPDVPIVAHLAGLVENNAGVLVPGAPLWEQTVIFTVKNSTGATVLQKAVITDPNGQAPLGVINLTEVDTYTVTADFAGTSQFEPSGISNVGTIAFITILADGQLTVWPTNNKMLDLSIAPDVPGYTPYYLEIEQDEDPGNSPDAAFENFVDVDGAGEVLPARACVLAQRDGGGDGRVYHISFVLINDNDSTDRIAGEGFLGTLPHDKSGDVFGINSAPPYYDSIGDGTGQCDQP